MTENLEHTTPFRLRNALLTITRCWPHMLPTVKATSTGTIGRHATSSRPPVPAHILDVRAEALSRLNGWTRIVLEERDLNTRLDGGNALAMGTFLKAHADWLADHPASEDVLDELEDSARRCQSVAEPHAALKFAGTCDVCGDDLMSNGRTARCQGCEVVVDGDTQKERIRERVKDRLWTQAAIVALSPNRGCGLRADQVSRWVKRKDLIAHGVNRQGLATYSAEDVCRLIDERFGQKEAS